MKSALYSMPSEHRGGIDTAVVLAGGLGTRLRSVVPDLPKPMAPIGSRPFLEHQFDYWISQGIKHFVVSVGYRHEVIMAHFGQSFHGAVIDYVIEESPLGTGGGLLQASFLLPSDRPFLLLNGDTYFAVSLEALEAFFVDHDADWCFSLFPVSAQERYMGMGVAPDGRISSLGSDSHQDQLLVNGGVYLVHPRSLRDFVGSADKAKVKISLENELFPQALSNGQRLFGLPCSGLFIDIGVPEDFKRAQHLLR